MTKENLQDLIDAHNILFGLSVTGAYIIPIGQAIAKLQAVIQHMAKELQNEKATVNEDDKASSEEEMSL